MTKASLKRQQTTRSGVITEVVESISQMERLRDRYDELIQSKNEEIEEVKTEYLSTLVDKQQEKV